LSFIVKTEGVPKEETPSVGTTFDAKGLLGFSSLMIVGFFAAV
jgi:hypothetical protein